MDADKFRQLIERDGPVLVIRYADNIAIAMLSPDFVDDVIAYKRTIGGNLPPEGWQSKPVTFQQILEKHLIVAFSACLQD